MVSELYMRIVPSPYRVLRDPGKGKMPPGAWGTAVGADRQRTTIPSPSASPPGQA